MVTGYVDRFRLQQVCIVRVCCIQEVQASLIGGYDIAAVTRSIQGILLYCPHCAHDRQGERYSLEMGPIRDTSFGAEHQYRFNEVRAQHVVSKVVCTWHVTVQSCPSRQAIFLHPFQANLDPSRRYEDDPNWRIHLPCIPVSLLRQLSFSTLQLLLDGIDPSSVCRPLPAQHLAKLTALLLSHGIQLLVEPAFLLRGRQASVTRKRRGNSKVCHTLLSTRFPVCSEKELDIGLAERGQTPRETQDSLAQSSARIARVENDIRAHYDCS